MPLFANSVITLLRGWSSLRVVLSLTRNFTVIAFTGWIYCIENFFTFSWNTELAVKFSTVLNTFFIIQDFSATCDCPEKQSCPENFHCIEHTFTFRIFEQLALALKTEFALKFFKTGGRTPPHPPIPRFVRLWEYLYAYFMWCIWKVKQWKVLKNSWRCWWVSFALKGTHSSIRKCSAGDSFLCFFENIWKSYSADATNVYVRNPYWNLLG